MHTNKEDCPCPKCNEGLNEKERYDKLLDRIIGEACESFKKDGSLMPTFFLEMERGLAVMGAPFDSDIQKQMSFHAMGAIATSADVTSVTFASEAWAATGTKEFLESGLRPAEAPEKREVLIIHGKHRKENFIGARTVQIFRDEDGNFTHLGEVEKLDSAEGYKATFPWEEAFKNSPQTEDFPTSSVPHDAEIM